MTALLFASALLLAQPAPAQAPAAGSLPDRTSPTAGWADDPPALASLVGFARGESDLRTVVTRYTQDRAALDRRYPVAGSPERISRFRRFADGWRARLPALDFDALNDEGKIDYIALRNRIDYDLASLKLVEERAAEVAPLLPFFDAARRLVEDRFDRKRADPQTTARTLDAIGKQARDLGKLLADRKPGAPLIVGGKTLNDLAPLRAADLLASLRENLKDWNTFYDGYDPGYTWWARKPYADLDAALQAYADTLKPPRAQDAPSAPIFGDPVLAKGLAADLTVEMIPYTPAELLVIGEKEFAWNEARLKEVATHMGYGDDWKAALEYAKTRAPAPGEAPWAIFDIANYEENFIANQHTITLAPLAREVWRLAMQSPERQLINPFFNGGEVTLLSYPTDTMTFDERSMSMRGNSPHLNFPTVQHEIVPGHHYQQFLEDRFNVHRQFLNDTPFWTEGWALYWELQLWDAKDFPRSDADRIGMLFWRQHRAARILFSMNYQLGKWTPQQCVDFLVDRVGHERANAEAEVRRTTQAPPLYQAAYLLGGLQLRSLYQELVGSGRMTAQQFHDGVLIGGPMPIELVRARLTNQKLTRDFRSSWRFYDLSTR
ncbi:MAG TPA: DUF885 family protein [Steroidobacteraceae bacterium]|nr:DUF885 family protein [Steroidobacteraceae bacterium]